MIKSISLTLLFFSLFFSSALLAQESDIYDACRSGNIEMLKTITESNPEAKNQVNEQGYTPLVIACYRNQIEVVEYLISMNVEINNKNTQITALQGVAYKGYAELAKILLENGADPDVADANGTTPLIYAVQFGHIEIVEELLKNKASIEITDLNGLSALDYAKQLGNKEILNQFTTYSE